MHLRHCEQSFLYAPKILHTDIRLTCSMQLCRITTFLLASTSACQNVRWYLHFTSRQRSSSKTPVFSCREVYFNSLLATLNAREFIRDGKSTRSIGTFGSGSGNGATGGSYPMPRIVTIGGSSASETRKSLGSSSPHSPARAEFDYVVEKVSFQAALCFVLKLTKLLSFPFPFLLRQ